MPSFGPSLTPSGVPSSSPSLTPGGCVKLRPKMGKGMEIFLGLFGLDIVWLILYSITNAVKTNKKVF